MVFRLFGSARRLALIVSVVVIFAILYYVVIILLPGPRHPQPGQVQRTLGATPPATQPATVAPKVTQTTTTLSATLKHFPLLPSTTWTYSYTDYDPDPNNPNKTLQAVFEVTHRVTDVKTVNGIYFAHIKKQVMKINEDPGWTNQNPNNLSDSGFWYLVRGDQVFSGPDIADPETLAKEKLVLEFVFPMAKDAEWCPNPVGKASVGDLATSVPCNPIGKRVVLAEKSFQSGKAVIEHCYQMSDIYNSGGAIQTFCDGLGVVEIKYDHAGTRFGFLQTLTSFKAGE